MPTSCSIASGREEAIEAARGLGTLRRAAAAPGAGRQGRGRSAHGRLGAQLRERFDAAALRGDRLHEQEAARFELDVEGKPADALAPGQAQLQMQKEPRDAEILLRAAAAARQPKAAKPALDWLADSRYEDPHLQQLAQALK